MVKRKVSCEGSEDPFQVKKKKVSVSCPNGKGKIDCSAPIKVLECLLGGTNIDEFLKTYWEKKPLLVKRNDLSFYGDIFSLETMKEVIKNNEINFESDVNVCRYVNNEKELLNEDRQITLEDVDKLIKEKQATFQFHHPQRYVDELWNIVEKLETYFGSLVGSNVYITPPSSQGLAPHCDDVEIFVLQLEGSKEWKLYKPMVELSRDYTQDLPQESIGEPIIEVTLDAGDLLYFPRGVIHQAKTVGTSHSTHISISTYQQNTWGDFMNHAVTQAIENALEDDVSVRSGLPINFSSMLGTGKNISSYIEDEADEKNENTHSNLNNDKVKEFKENVKNHLTKLVDYIDVNTAADAMCADFMVSRLPPYGHVAKEEEEDYQVILTLDDKIKVRYPEHVRIIYDNMDDEEYEGDEYSDEEDMEEEDEKPAKSNEQSSAKGSKSKSSKGCKKAVVKNIEGEIDDDDDEDAEVADIESHIKIIHSVGNDRFSHMGPGVYDERLGDIKLHVNFAKAAIEILNNHDFIAVKDLAMEDEEDKLFLANALLEHNLVEVKSE